MTHPLSNDWRTHFLAQDIAECLQQWHLCEPQLIAATNMGVILRVKRNDGVTAVLKCLSEIGMREEGQAGDVLRSFAGKGAVRVYETAENALLMEDCTGVELAEFSRSGGDDIATPIICDIVRNLHAGQGAVAQDLPTLAGRCEVLKTGADQGTNDQMRAMFQRAYAVSKNLLKTTRKQVLLHGDLHHGNILRTVRDGKNAWVCIDPQGIVGDPAYDLSNIFGNPIGENDFILDPSRPQRLASNLAKALNLDAGRILCWAFVHANISSVWSLQDGEDPSIRLRLAQNIEHDPRVAAH